MRALQRLVILSSAFIILGSTALASSLPEPIQPAAMAIEAGNTQAAITALMKLPDSNEREALLALAYKLKHDGLRSFYYSKRASNLDEAAYNISTFYLDRADVSADARQMLIKMGSAAVQPDNGNGLAWLAGLHEARGSMDGAMELYTLGHENYPKNPKLASGLGEQYLKQGDANKAIVFFTRAHLLELNKPEHMVNLGRAFYKAGRPDRALELWNKALVIDPSNNALYKDIQKVTAEMAGSALGQDDVTQDDATGKGLATDPSGVAAPPIASTDQATATTTPTSATHEQSVTGQPIAAVQTPSSNNTPLNIDWALKQAAKFIRGWIA